MNLFKVISNYGIKLFFYFTKGARVDAALQKTGRIRARTLVDFPKLDAELIVEDGVPIGYDADDIIRGWTIETQGNLILKNNSKNYAYNLKLLNAESIFDKHKSLEKLTSLAPNESVEVSIKFIQNFYAHSGLEADKLPDIPKEKENRILDIQYENESGTKFLTKFSVSFLAIYNEYTYSKK